MENSIYNYISYFRLLATEHHLILHNPQQERPDATEKGACRFVLFDTDEVVTSLRSLVGNGVVLYLEAYTFQGRDNEAGDFRSAHQCRFIIAKKYNSKNQAGLIDAYTECEGIVWDFINRIVHDSNFSGQACGTPFRNLSLNNFSCEPVDKLWDNRAGWLVEMTYQQPRNNIINAADAADTDIWTPYTPPAPGTQPPALETDYSSAPS